MRRALTVLLALGLALGLPRGGASGQDDLAEAPLPLDPVARLGAIDERLALARADAERASADRARVETELAGLGDARAAADRRVRDRTRALYRMTRAGVLPLAGGLESMLGHVARVERLERMVRHDLDALGDVGARATALRDETARIAVRADAASARIARLEAARSSVQDEVRRATLYGAAFSDATFGAASAPAPLAAAASTFEAERGRLTLPLAAPRALREASREDGGGLELDGTRGAPVRASADGRVAFSDRHPSYGRMIIVDHGQGHFTIYGGLARSDVRVGTEVARGDTLGAVDTEPLFFQVRRGTRALDARAWLGL